MSRFVSIKTAVQSVAGFAILVVIAALVVFLLSSREATNRSPVGANAPPAGNGAVAASSPEPAIVSEPANADPFRAECVREAHRMARQLSDTELAALDANAEARGGPGHWMVAGDDPWASGQLWIGSKADAIRAYGATAVSGEDTGRSGEWIVTTREGKPIAMTLKSIELPSGLTLWLPQDTIVPVDCPPDQ